LTPASDIIYTFELRPAHAEPILLYASEPIGAAPGLDALLAKRFGAKVGFKRSADEQWRE
jgi:hypothetical protein